MLVHRYGTCSSKIFVTFLFLLASFSLKTFLYREVYHLWLQKRLRDGFVIRWRYINSLLTNIHTLNSKCTCLYCRLRHYFREITVQGSLKPKKRSGWSRAFLSAPLSRSGMLNHIIELFTSPNHFHLSCFLYTHCSCSHLSYLLTTLVLFISKNISCLSTHTCHAYLNIHVEPAFPHLILLFTQVLVPGLSTEVFPTHLLTLPQLYVSAVNFAQLPAYLLLCRWWMRS